MSNKPIRLGFIGLSTHGWASMALVPPLLQAPLSSKYSLVAVSTSNADSAAASAQKYTELKAAGSSGGDAPVKAYHGPASQIASDPDVDMIAVAINSTFQKEAALSAIEAGKDVFIEWPVGRSLQETQELADAAKRKGVRSLIGAQTRLSGYVDTIKEIIDSGKLGKIVSTSFIGSYPRELLMWGPQVSTSHAYALSASNGVTLLEVGGGHLIDMFAYVFGPIQLSSISTGLFKNQYPTAELVDPSTRQPTGEVRKQETPHQLAFSGSFASGSVFNAHVRGALPASSTSFTWIIDGENGSLKVEENAPFVMSSKPDVHLNGEKVEIKEETPFQKIARAWEDFADGTGKATTLEDALNTKEVLEEIKKSAVAQGLC
ncbi:transcription regulator gal80 [Paramarasmius palmivorus]|uniref:Transcription regulator gal80 n=1 Tax=Paramarasmius palmivorus TaxID=297713 RepID=A0AAW0CHQ1_9AGAR